ncbi:tyrosinase family protein [Pseudonocardia sp. GCM10023141]
MAAYQRRQCRALNVCPITDTSPGTSVSVPRETGDPDRQKGEMMPHTPVLHASAHSRSAADLTAADRTRLRQLLDTYITTQDPVGEHLAAQNNPGLMIHDTGFLAWHAVFVGKLENWLVVNGAADMVPLPFWDPATAIPVELDKGNTAPNLPLPDALRPGAIAAIPNYTAVNAEMVDYHNRVHNAAGGQLPFPATSPSDPLFWPLHAFLLNVYDHWRAH